MANALRKKFASRARQKNTRKTTELQRLEDRLEKLHKNGSMWIGGMMELPHVDMYEEEGMLVALFYMPNFKKKEVEYGTEDNTLEVHAEKISETNKSRRYIMQETRTSYWRRVVLPKGVNVKELHAVYKENILVVSMPFSRSKIKMATIE